MKLSDADRRKLWDLLAQFEYEELKRLLGSMTPPVDLDRISSKFLDMNAVSHDVIEKVELARLWNPILEDSETGEPLKELARKYATHAVLPASSHNNGGDTLQYLCDRWDQERLFCQRFRELVTPSTLVCFLPGPEGAMHSSFVRRLQSATLPELLRKQGLTAEGATIRIPASWVEGPPRGDETAYLLEKLASRLGTQLPGLAPFTAAGVKQHPTLHHRVLLLEHSLYVKWWSPHMIPLLKEYLDFWGAPAGGDVSARVVLFFHVVFPANGGDNAAGILESLKNLQIGAGCATLLLSSLGCIERPHVDEWINMYLSDHIYEGMEMAEALFDGKDCLPMGKVEPRLYKFVKER